MSEGLNNRREMSPLLGSYIILVISPLLGYFFSLWINKFIEVEPSSTAVGLVCGMTVMTLYEHRRLFFGTNPDGTMKRGKVFRFFTYLGVCLGGLVLFFPLHFIGRVVPISEFSLYLIGLLVLTHLIYLVVYIKLRSRLH